jgi:caffeoyl-CoA O-methyltransferase
VRLARPGSLIIADNVIRSGEVLNASGADVGLQGVRRFNEALAADRRVTATIVQMVGSKGYDGMALAVVRGE